MGWRSWGAISCLLWAYYGYVESLHRVAWGNFIAMSVFVSVEPDLSNSSWCVRSAVQKNVGYLCRLWKYNFCDHWWAVFLSIRWLQLVWFPYTVSAVAALFVRLAFGTCSFSFSWSAGFWSSRYVGTYQFSNIFLLSIRTIPLPKTVGLSNPTEAVFDG